MIGDVRTQLLAFLSDEFPSQGPGSVHEIADGHRYVVCTRETRTRTDHELVEVLRTLGLDAEIALNRDQRRCYGFAELDAAMCFQAPGGFERVALWDSEKPTIVRALITPDAWSG